MNAVIPYNHGNMELVYVVLKGLTPDAFYRDIASGKVYPSDALMDAGLPLEMPKGDCEAFTFRMERV